MAPCLLLRAPMLLLHADKTDLGYTIRIISTHASWLGRLIIHDTENFPLP